MGCGIHVFCVILHAKCKTQALFAVFLQLFVVFSQSLRHTKEFKC